MALPPREFYKFNQDKSFHHFKDPSEWVEGAESFLNVFDRGGMFDLTTYSQVKKEYELRHEGVNVFRHEYIVESDDTFSEMEDVTGEIHRIETEWEINSPQGYFEVEVDGFTARVSWGEGKITDLNGVEARLTSDFEIVEDLEIEEEDRLIEINRLERLLGMTEDSELRKQITFKVASLNYRG
jgi:hypothetical protein